MSADVVPLRPLPEGWSVRARDAYSWRGESGITILTADVYIANGRVSSHFVAGRSPGSSYPVSLTPWQMIVALEAMTALMHWLAGAPS